MKKILIIVLCSVLMIACAAEENETGNANGAQEALYQLFDEEWAFRLEANPVMATLYGVHDYNDLLADVSPEAYEAQLRARKGFLDRLHAIPTDTLSVEDKLNYDLFEYDLGWDIEQASFHPRLMPFTSDYGFYSGLPLMHENMPLRTTDDYQNYIARLNAIPQFFDQHIANMETGIEEGITQPRIIVEKVLPQVMAFADDEVAESPFYVPFANFPENIAVEEQETLRYRGAEAVQTVVNAYEDLHAFFRDTYLPAARESIGLSDVPNGSANYEMLTRYFTTLDITPAEVHEIGLREVARIRGEMEDIIEEVGFEGTFAEFLAFLRTDPQFYARTPEELLKHASWLAKRIDGQLPSLFGKLPRQPYGVRAVPDEIAPNYTTGRYWGAPLDGKQGGFYMVNTYALRERPLYNLPALTLHEGVPGHHLQIALGKELENVPAFRKALYPNAFGEGWGLYSEKLGIEMNMYDTPYDHFGRLSYEMWRAGRLVVDTGMHYMGWTREEAVRLFMENSALAEHNINTEVDRYISWPAQALAYKMGELKIIELRQKASDALGENFDIREFHDVVLSAGGIPLGILEDRVDAYIAANQ